MEKEAQTQSLAHLTSLCLTSYWASETEDVTIAFNLSLANAFSIFSRGGREKANSFLSTEMLVDEALLFV